jgi:DNA-binding PadR family transcriptional regulator
MSTTRLLILGILTDKPRHGYDIRRELELWDAEQWANIAYGSIYSALSTLAKDGYIEPVNSDNTEKKHPTARTEYAITERGRGEFERLLREYWWTPKPIIDPFQAALTFMHKMPRDELLAALRYRAESLRPVTNALDYMIKGKMSNPSTPRHIAESVRLSVAHMETELRWIEEAIGKIERGELP